MSYAFFLNRELEIIAPNSDTIGGQPPLYSLFDIYIRYFFLFKNLMDFLTILPYYVFFGLKSGNSSVVVFLRVFRLVKVIRLYKGSSRRVSEVFLF